MNPHRTTKLDVAAQVIANDVVGPDCYRLDLRCPDLAPTLGPGQFVEVRCSPSYDPLLRRPFSLCDTLFEDGVPVGIRLLYIVVGRGTELMAALSPGDEVEVVGPLGGTFFLDRIPDHAVLVAGGIGVAPFPALIRHLRDHGCSRIEMLFGARSAPGLYYRDELEALGCTVRPATEDGTAGHHGFVTDLLRDLIPTWDEASTVIYTCGPNPMFKAMGPVLSTTSIPCQMSLEQVMACGFGVCNGCVVKVRGPDGPVWKKVCTDGAVFAASDLVLEDL
jgi:dihydroorotate dehydrogenase electron transfer subunit